MRTLISLSLLTLSIHADSTIIVVGQPLTGGAGPSYLINQNFEGTGYDNSETWTETGNPDEDYATAPAPLVGSQSLYIDGSAATKSAISPNFGDQLTFSVFFKLHVVTLPGSTGRELIRFLLNGSQSAGSELTVNSTGVLTLTVGTTTISTTTTVSAGTTYNVWVDYTAESPDTALNGVGQVAFSTGTTKPTSDGGGNGYGRRTNMNGELAVDQLWITAQFSTTGPTWICDKFLLDDVTIGNNP